MIYKKYDFKISQKQYRKYIFYILLITYTIGLCAGCSYTCKNLGQMGDFSVISFVEKSYELDLWAILGGSVHYLIKDITLLVSVIVLKYSGILRGMTATVPFIFSLQNGCAYIGALSDGVNVVNIMLNYVVRDSAVAFMLLIYCYINVYDIILKRESPIKDLQKMTIYLTGLMCIYAIDYAVKIMVYCYM